MKIDVDGGPNVHVLTLSHLVGSQLACYVYFADMSQMEMGSKVNFSIPKLVECYIVNNCFSYHTYSSTNRQFV